MANVHFIEDKNRQTIGALYFCCDNHQKAFLMREENQQKYGRYQGWYGCAELSQDEACFECGKTIKGAYDG